MPSKQVTVLFRGTPFASRRLAEGLRMGVGQTLAEHRVRLIFVGDAVYILGGGTPSAIGGGEVALPLETLGMLGGELVAEAEALEARGVRLVYSNVRLASRAEIARLLLESDVVIAW